MTANGVGELSACSHFASGKKQERIKELRKETVFDEAADAAFMLKPLNPKPY